MPTVARNHRETAPHLDRGIQVDVAAVRALRVAERQPIVDVVGVVEDAVDIAPDARPLAADGQRAAAEAGK